MDKKDIQILKIIQSSGRMPNAAIARQVGLAPSAVFERLRKLEKQKIICGYFARLDAKQLGRGVLGFVLVFCEGRAKMEGVATALAAIKEVQELHYLSGVDALLVKLRVRDLEELDELIRERIRAAPSVERTQTSVVLKTWKEATDIEF